MALAVPRSPFRPHKTQGWRGSVKAQKFVMTLKDYFVEKTTGDSGSLMSPDGWALNYINIGRARGILEAFDDDAGGFVSINEVNTFTRSRPLSWRCVPSPPVSSVICLPIPQPPPLDSLLGNR